MPMDWINRITSKVITGARGSPVTVTSIPAVWGNHPEAKKFGQSGPAGWGT